MLFFGHIAIAIAAADIARVDTGAAVAGNLLPDVADKTGAWLRIMPSGRWLAHGLPFVTLTCVAARAFLPERLWRGFVLGYGSHLVADHWAGGRLPWLAPFGRRPQRARAPWSEPGWLAANLLPEIAGVAFIAHRARVRRTSRA